MQPPRSILSLQSWVVYGHVGNAAAIFPLQRIGFEVWAIHTVQFSNHTGYGSWRGMVTPPEHLQALVEGLDERGVLGQCDAVLAGYIGASAKALLSVLARVRQLNPRALFCCDPVMGDDGRGLFVRPEIPEIIKHQLLPQADIVTPNQFELELLAERKTHTLSEVLEAAQAVRARLRPTGPRIVVVTGMLRAGTPEGSIETLALADAGAWRVRTPYLFLKPPRSGTGDVLTALFLGHYLRSNSLTLSLENAVSATYNTLLLTQQLNTRELQLVAAQEEYVHPSRRFPAEKVE